METVLVTGGCGYIGSHTIVDLLLNGYHVVSVDDLSNADEGVLEGIARITGKKIRNYPINLCDFDAIGQIFHEHPEIRACIHFAAYKSVEESKQFPFKYFHNNLNSLMNILKWSRDQKLGAFVFSSSCTVYGNAQKLPVTEDTPVARAESPYGRTKQISEMIIEDMVVQDSPGAIMLRYFNPAGAHPSAHIGESPKNKATNLVPVITETAIGLRDKMQVFGTDYPTRDGSCVRDYIHVMDLAHAHTLALQYLLEGKQSVPVDVFNLGIGEGVTVLEAIHAFEDHTGVKLNYELGPRRAGDVIAIYADYSKARALLGWEPQLGIEEIMTSAWQWEQERRK